MKQLTAIAAAAFLFTGCEAPYTGSRPSGPVPLSSVDASALRLPDALDQPGREAREAQLEKYRQAFAIAQQQRLDHRSERLRGYFRETVSAGGLTGIMQRELKRIAARANDADAPFSAMLKRKMKEAAACRKPAIWNESSLFVEVFDPRIDRAEFEFAWVAEPGGKILIFGCGFGKTAGSLVLTLASTGEQLPISVEPGNWSNDAIFADFPNTTGKMDQAAQLIVVAAAGLASEPLEVQFVATRALEYVDTFSHRDLFFGICSDATNDDRCGGIAPGDAVLIAASFFGRHYRDCCSSVSGTDQFFLALKNNWGLPTNEVPIGKGKTSWGIIESTPTFVWSPFSFNTATGWTQCDLFNQKGQITGESASASNDPRFVVQLDFSWWVDWICSGAVYSADLLIMGPAGVPYW